MDALTPADPLPVNEEGNELQAGRNGPDGPAAEEPKDKVPLLLVCTLGSAPERVAATILAHRYRPLRLYFIYSGHSDNLLNEAVDSSPGVLQLLELGA